MASAKRKIISEEETEKRKKKKKTAAEIMEDLPPGCLDAKEAIQTTKLSRSWETRIPIMEINNFSFHNRGSFRKFVKEILSPCDPLAKLDSLKLKCKYDDPYRPWCSAKILKRVFEYAFSHGVKYLEASIESITEINSWPVCPCDSFTSLKLQSKYQRMRCPFLRPRSVLFKNLTVLYLEGALITDVEPFSGFPVLESLTLLDCLLLTYGNESKTLKVHTLGLSDLTISNCSGVQCWELSTPRLKVFKYRGSGFLKHEGLPVNLETFDMDFDGLSYYRHKDKEGEERTIDDLMSLFSTWSGL